MEIGFSLCFIQFKTVNVPLIPPPTMAMVFVIFVVRYWLIGLGFYAGIFLTDTWLRQ
jgi:hypothetical protein